MHEMSMKQYLFSKKIYREERPETKTFLKDFKPIGSKIKKS